MHCHYFRVQGLQKRTLSNTVYMVRVASELLQERVEIYRHLYPSVTMFQGDVTDDSIYIKKSLLLLKQRNAISL